MAGIGLTDYIKPKNDAFTGIVQASQVLGGGADGTLPVACVADNSVVAGKLSITATHSLLARVSAGAGAGEELAIGEYSFPGRVSNGVLQSIGVAANRLVGRTATSGLADLGKADFTEEGSPTALDFVIGYLADGSLARYDVDNFVLVSGLLANWDAGAFSITANQLLVGDADDTSTPSEYLGVGTGQEGKFYALATDTVYLDSCGEDDDFYLRANDGGTMKTFLEITAADALLTLGSSAGSITLGEAAQASVAAVYPLTNAKFNLGIVTTNEFNDAFFDGTVQTDALRIDGGGSTAISTGAGSVKMTSANPADNTAWIPINYAGAVYYVPGWTTHAP